MDSSTTCNQEQLTKHDYNKVTASDNILHASYESEVAASLNKTLLISPSGSENTPIKMSISEKVNDIHQKSKVPVKKKPSHHFTLNNTLTDNNTSGFKIRANNHQSYEMG